MPELTLDQRLAVALPDNTARQSTARRARTLFVQQQQALFARTDRSFAWLMMFQWLAAIVVALWVSPRTWAGQMSQTHPHVWAALFLGGAISLYPIWLAVTRPGEAITRYTVSTAQMLMGGLLIHLTGGRIETHFHVFGSLAFLAFYRDWRVLIPAVIVVYLDHFLRGIYWPYSVFGVLTASPWRVVEHAGWVIFECVFLVLAIVRSVDEMKFIAGRTAEMEATKQIIEDTVARRTAELKASEERFRKIFEEGPLGMAVVEPDFRFSQVNARMVQMLGYSAQELLGLTFEDITHPADLADNRRLVEQLLHGEIPRFMMEKRYITKSGGVLWVELSVALMRDEAGRPQYGLTMVEDITERKRAAVALQAAKEEAERANAAKSEFLSRMSHELRTPLNAILGFGQLLEMDDLNDEQRQGVEQILKAGRHQLELVDRILDVASIETGRLDIALEPVALGPLLRAALDAARPLAVEREVRLRFEDGAEQCASFCVLADRARLVQVLGSLLSNAIQYNRAGGEVSLWCRAIATGDRLRIAVQDTGAGMTPEQVGRLFTLFERLGAEAAGVAGTGIGLTLCKGWVEAMGGTLSVQSTLGQGSTFSIELALTAGGAAPDDANPSLAAVETAAAGTAAAGTAAVETASRISRT